MLCGSAGLLSIVHVYWLLCSGKEYQCVTFLVNFIILFVQVIMTSFPFEHCYTEQICGRSNLFP